MAVYDDQQTRPESKELDDLNQLTGISPAEEQSIEDRAITDDMAERNQLDNKTEDSDKKSPDSGDGDEIPYNADDGKRRRGFRLTKKQGITGGIVGLIVGLALSITSFLTGPLQIVHISSLLRNFHFSSSEYASNSRVGRMFEYIRTTRDPSKRNVSFLMENVTDRHRNNLAARGITMDFDTPAGGSSRRISGLTIDPNTPEGSRTIQQLQSADFGNFTNTPDGKVHFEFRNTDPGDREGTRRRREALKIAANTGERGVISNAISKRLLIHRAGVDFHPLRNMRRTLGESMADYRIRAKESRAERHRSGQIVPNTRLEGVTNNPEGEPVSDPTSVDAAEGNDIADQAKAAKSPRARLDIAKRLAGGGAAVVGALCMVRNIGDGIVDYQHANIVMPMMRMSMGIITTGSQVMTGQNVNMEELGAVVSDFYDEETGSSIMAGRAMQASARQPLTGPDAPIKPSDDIVNNKPELFNIVEGVPGLNAACGVQDGIMNTISGIPIVGSAVSAVESMASWGIDAALSTVGLSMDGLMEMVVSTLAGDIVDPYAQGATLGNYVALGSRLSANDSSIAAGGARLSPVAEAEVRDLRFKEIKEGFQAKSLFARIFDVKDVSSLVSQIAITSSAQGLGSSGIKNLSTLLNPVFVFNSLSNVSSLVFARAGAQQSHTSYEWGVPAYGFTASELDDERFANPYEVAEWVDGVDGRLQSLNERYGKCFGTTIDPSTFRLNQQQTPTFETLNSGDCTSSSIEKQYYRFYLLDTITAKSLACYEGVDDSSCTELGFGGQLTADTPQSAQPSTAVVGSTSETPCAPGTEDMGTETGYSGGNAYSIRLCAIPGFISGNEEGNGNLVRVNSTVSGNWLELYRKSQEQGINLNARGSFRSMERQEYFWGCYQSKRCNGGNQAARPGWSNHQMGFSVDIAMDASGLSVANCEARRSSYPIYRFLAENAPPLGIQADVSSECWHWTSK